MKRVHDPARATSDRLRSLERQSRARRDTKEVGEGIAESVALSRARGAAFEKESAGKAGRETPYRRQTGLQWLRRKGRINDIQAQAGERYGEAFRAAGATPAIGSTLEVQPGSSAGGPPLGLILKQAEGRRQAELRLAGFRGQLLHQADLVGVCDLVCGRELTPREAAGGERDAARLEAVLKVALDLLGASGGTRRRS